jgi:hypothetical protein
MKNKIIIGNYYFKPQVALMLYEQHGGKKARETLKQLGEK